MDMKIKVNGEETQIEKDLTILMLLERLVIDPHTVVVEYNYQVPLRETWGEMMLQEGDNIEIVRFMGGG